MAQPREGRRRLLLPDQSRSDRTYVLDALRQETVGGALLLLATVVALVWANSPWQTSYAHARAFMVGPLPLEAWASDGLLAVFFFVAGLELKRELLTGSLRHLSRAAVPVVAALAGMAVPAVLFVGVVLGAGDRDALPGWAIPTATDIAFALAVLAVAGPRLPPALRAFLLTLAVVDDLGAITVIAVFFTDSVHLVPLALAAVLLGVYALLQLRRVGTPFVYVPLALAIWWCFHESGVHPTVAGVALGLLTRVRADPGEEHAPAERLEHRFRPWSAGIAVPLFALAAAGVPVSVAALTDIVADPAAVGVVAGLVVGKTVGVFGGAWLTARLTHAELNPDLSWRDILAVSVLSGVGFTVCLLLAELAFGSDPARVERTKAAVLVASLVAAAAATVLLRLRHRAHVVVAALGMPQDRGGYDEDEALRESFSRQGAIMSAHDETSMRDDAARGRGQATSAASARMPGQSGPGPDDLPSGPSQPDGPSLGQLVASASRDLSALVRGEIALAKAELKESVAAAGKGAGMFGAAGFLAYVAFLMLSVAAALGLWAAGLHPAFGFLIVAGVYLVIAAILAYVGKRSVGKAGPPARTIHSIEEAKAMVSRGDH